MKLHKYRVSVIGDNDEYVNVIKEFIVIADSYESAMKAAGDCDEVQSLRLSKVVATKKMVAAIRNEGYYLVSQNDTPHFL